MATVSGRPADRQRRCTVQVTKGGAAHLAFEPCGAPPSPSNSFFTLDLRPGVTVEKARERAAQINARLRGVSTNIFDGHAGHGVSRDNTY